MSGPLSPAYRVLTVLLLAQVTMVAFEQMAVSTAMPAVASDLDAVRSFGLAFSFMLSASLLGTVLAGPWCDRRGPLDPIVAGQVLFGLGSLGCALATSMPALLAGRVVTGLGGGLLVVALYVVIGRVYPGPLLPRVFGWISAAWVLPAIVGPFVAGALAEHASWRWVFGCVVPVAVVTTAMTWARRATIGGPSQADPAPGARRTALLGTVLALGAGVLQWGSASPRPGQLLPLVLTLAGLGAVAVAAPRLVPGGTVRLARGVPSVMASRFLLTAAFNGAMPFVPLMLVTERSLTTTAAGVVLMLGSIGWSAGSALQAREGGPDRHRVLTAGGVVVAVGSTLLAVTAALGLPWWLVTVAMVLDGLGMGLAMSTISVLALDLTPVAEHGAVSSSLQLSDTLGSALGTALTGALFAARHLGAGQDEPVYALLWAACGGIGVIACVAGARTRPPGEQVEGPVRAG